MFSTVVIVAAAIVVVDVDVVFVVVGAPVVGLSADVVVGEVGNVGNAAISTKKNKKKESVNLMRANESSPDTHNIHKPGYHCWRRAGLQPLQ
jgi:hypothetical protein